MCGCTKREKVITIVHEGVAYQHTKVSMAIEFVSDSVERALCSVVEAYSEQCAGWSLRDVNAIRQFEIAVVGEIQRFHHQSVLSAYTLPFFYYKVCKDAPMYPWFLGTSRNLSLVNP